MNKTASISVIAGLALASCAGRNEQVRSELSRKLPEAVSVRVQVMRQGISSGAAAVMECLEKRTQRLEVPEIPAEAILQQLKPCRDGYADVVRSVASQSHDSDMAAYLNMNVLGAEFFGECLSEAALGGIIRDEVYTPEGLRAAVARLKDVCLVKTGVMRDQVIR